MFPAMAQIWTTWSEDECTNYEVAVPPMWEIVYQQVIN